MALPGTETIRFRRPTSGPNAIAPKKPVDPEKDQFGSLAPQGWKKRHQGLLQDKLGRAHRGPMVPSLSVAVRMLALVRTAGAMYSIISDCDEVFNFWEPLHYFQHNSGFQTWELSPEFAIRSWSYILLHWPLASFGPKLLRLGKRQQFFALRILLGFICTICEAKFYRAVVETVNQRVGRYVLFSLLLSAGMWSSGTAFLPSTFSMYTTMLAASFWFHPATSTPTGVQRATRATLCFAVGAIVGWPFTAALGIPFLLEQVLTTGGEIAAGPERDALRNKRIQTVVRAILLGALVTIPVFLVDSWAYGRPTLPVLNIVRYNLFSHGPNLYGTSPSTFYFANLFLNFNYLFPFALLSLPLLAVTYFIDNRRLGKTQQATVPGETSPYTLLCLRLAPFYLWLAILTLQSHKEERFAYPLYPLLCLNSAVSVYLIKGFMELVYIKITASPYEASRATMFSNFALFAILVPGIISLARIFALHKFYHAPFDVAHHFEYNTVPDILTSLGYSPKPLPANYQPYGKEVPTPEWDYTPLQELESPITLCYGTEWHRYPGSHLIPEGIEVRFLQTEFSGIMPRKWQPSPEAITQWPRSETKVVRQGLFNGENKPSAQPDFIRPEECNYLVALHLPSQPPSPLEPDWASKPEWEREYCTTFLDAGSSKWWARLVWLPGGVFEENRTYGEYCLLKRKV